MDVMLWKYHSAHKCCSTQNHFHTAVIVTWVVSFQTAQGLDLLAVWGSRSGCLEVAQCGVPDQSEMLGQGYEALPVCDCSFHWVSCSLWAPLKLGMIHGQVCSPQLLGSKAPDLFFLRKYKVKSLQSWRVPWGIARDLALLGVMTQAAMLMSTHMCWSGRDSKLQAAVRCLLMGRAAAGSEMSVPCATSRHQLLENWTRTLYSSLFFLKSFDVHVKMWPPEAPDLPLLPRMVLAGPALH